MPLLPIFLKVAGKPVLVVGAGALAEAKVATLLELDAQVHVVAPRGGPAIAKWAGDGVVDWQRRVFGARDLDGKWIVFAATGVRDVDRAVSQQSRERAVLCNAIDDPDYCDFYTPAVVQRGDLQIAISTNGQSPALAQQLRQLLEQRFDTSWSERVAELGQRRRHIIASMPKGEERNRVLQQMARAAVNRAGQPAPNLWTRSRNAVVRWLNEDDDKVALI